MSLLNRAIKNSYRALANRDIFFRFLGGKNTIYKNGQEFQFHYYDPNVKHKSTNPPRIASRDPLMPPYEPYVELGHYQKNGASHYLILNKYQLMPGHLIMAVDNQKEIQGSFLTNHDFSMLSQLLNQVDDRGVAYYNGGIDAGCTQLHKHLQYVPSFDNPLFDAMATGQKLPYKYYTEKLDDYRPSSIGDAYKRLFERMNFDGSYNFLISNKIAAIVPRRKAKHETGVLVSSMAMCGHLYVGISNGKKAAENPLKIISDVSFPN
ncbi:hypothetical protein M9Y10_003291 [Tritrichomonas musculus]|uniref:Uncharacterized protein n=1 Tax=Tritrichomonas musculus TaxID=1915356 RepID=A0ABR2JP37_9EUKA